MSKSMVDFIKEHRKEIDNYIAGELHGPCCPLLTRTSDKERRLWIMNAERLYLWAKKEGVEV